MREKSTLELEREMQNNGKWEKLQIILSEVPKVGKGLIA